MELFLPSCWECGTDIFFPATEKKTKKALKVLTYHCYGLYVAVCENVSLGTPEIRVSFPLIVKYHVMNTCTNFKQREGCKEKF